MKTKKLLSIGVISFLFMGNTTFANSNILASQNGLSGNSPRGQNMELPDDWDDMTAEERQEYMTENSPRRKPNQ